MKRTNISETQLSPYTGGRGGEASHLTLSLPWEEQGNLRTQAKLSALLLAVVISGCLLYLNEPQLLNLSISPHPITQEGVCLKTKIGWFSTGLGLGALHSVIQGTRRDGADGAGQRWQVEFMLILWDKEGIGKDFKNRSSKMVPSLYPRDVRILKSM